MQTQMSQINHTTSGLLVIHNTLCNVLLGLEGSYVEFSKLCRFRFTFTLQLLSAGSMSSLFAQIPDSCRHYGEKKSHADMKWGDTITMISALSFNSPFFNNYGIWCKWSHWVNCGYRARNCTHNTRRGSQPRTTRTHCTWGFRGPATNR